MKVTQEVREFAARQHNNPPRDGEGDQPQAGGGAQAVDPDAAEAGMAAMSEVFRETDSELYIGAGGREHD